MTFLRIDSSIRYNGSVSRELTDTVERVWLAEHPRAQIVHRDLVAGPALYETWRQAATAGFLPEDQHTPAMRDAKIVASHIADEVLAADAITIGVPLYNLGIPAALKSWIDLLITDSRLNPRTTPMGQSLAGVPVSLIIARGGGYGPGTPRWGWDHSTPYIQRIFDDVFGAEVTLIVAELTASDADPAMEPLRPQAQRSRADAHALAESTAIRHAARMRPTSAAS